MATKRKYDNPNDNSGEKEEIDTVVPAKKRQKLLTKRTVSDDVTIETSASNQSGGGSGTDTDENDEKRQHSHFSDPFDRNNDRGFEFTSQLAKIGNNQNQFSNNTNNKNNNNSNVNYKQWQKQFVYDLKTEGCVHKVAFPPTFKDTNDAIKQVLCCFFFVLLFFILFCFVLFCLSLHQL